MAGNSGLPARRGPGRPWRPGESGNPSGRPRAIAAVRDLAQQHTAEAIEALREIMLDRKASAMARVAAATAILDRAWGKPAQPLVGDEGTAALRIVIERPAARPPQTDGAKGL